MREIAVNTLTELLSDNIGNKLTPALATGILTLLNQTLLNKEAESVIPNPADDQK